jgi:predicted PurR-regulated permease PerM
MKAETGHYVEFRVPWATLLKIIAAIAVIYLWNRLAWVVMLVLVAIIIAIGLAPAVDWLERRRCPIWLASWGLVGLILGVLIGFFLLTWSSLSAEAQHLGGRIELLEQELLNRTPKTILKLVRGSAAPPDPSVVAPYLISFGQGVLNAAAAFGLAWILVAYLLMEARPTYRWIRAFVPAKRRAQFDATAGEACEAASGFIFGNVVTSVCAGIYFFVWLTLLGVPAALLLAVVAFFCDFIPVMGFFLSCIPAMAMAATRSTTVVLVVIALYIAYHFIETYLISPRVYGERLRLSNVAVLLAFAVGAELGGVLGAVLALPLAAVYPTIERHWLRQPFGDDVIEEHEAVSSEASEDRPATAGHYTPKKRSA